MSRTTILSAIILSAVLAACTDVTDSPIPVSDNKPWTIDENDKDTSYKPGDDFFMYCNGGYWKAHAASLAQDEPAIVSLARTDAIGVLNEQLATLERPSLQVMKCHATTYTPEQGEATMQQWLAPLTNATTLEEAWQADGQHTISEDIADLGGFEIAFQTYTDHLTSHGFHGDELRRQQWLFYQAYAHIWRARYTDAYAQERVTGDIHSLPRERVNALVPHTDAWYDLFNVKPGDNLYIAPENRVHIW